MNEPENRSLDELFAVARGLRAPAGAEARGWARFEAAIAGPGAPVSASTASTAAKAAGLGRLAKLGGALAVTVAVAVPLLGDAGTRAARPPTAASEPITVATVDTRGTPAVAPASLPEVVAPNDAPVPAPNDASNDAPNDASNDAPSDARRRVSVAGPAGAPAVSPAPAVPLVPQRVGLPPVRGDAAAVDSLRAEAELLGRAWVAIREGRKADTQTLLAEHVRRFPDGALVPERRACELVARCASGSAEALAQARDYLRDHGDSRLAARIATGCNLPRPVEPSRLRDEPTTDPADGSR
jgi:hypothetical protein